MEAGFTPRQLAQSFPPFPHCLLSGHASLGQPQPSLLSLLLMPSPPPPTSVPLLSFPRQPIQMSPPPKAFLGSTSERVGTW